MSINSSIGSVDSPTSSVENDAIASSEIPLTVLSERTLLKLSQLLSYKKDLRSMEGYESYCLGLAALAKQKSLCDENTISGDDAVIQVIKLWCNNNPKTATLSYLEKFLGIIDRWDVFDDIYENLIEDTKIYQNKQQQSLNLKLEDNAGKHSANVCDDFGHGSDPNILTTNYVLRAQKGLLLQKYDAFVLYDDADLNYATEILAKLEDSPDYNCILTKEFLKSHEKKFLANYIQALQIQHKTRKIIPLLYKDTVVIPRIQKIYTHLRHNSAMANLFNLWSKLANSIRNVTRNTVEGMLSSPACRNDFFSLCVMYRELPDTFQYNLNILPTPPIEITSTRIIPPDNNARPKKKERTKLKPSTMRIKRNKVLLNDGMAMRNAYSTGQSDLSTSSICRETKKKKKWPSKFLKKIFSRSSSKLQETS